MQAHTMEQTAQLQDRLHSSLAAHALSDWGSDFGSMIFSRTISLDSSEGGVGAGTLSNAEAVGSRSHRRVFAADGAGSPGHAEAICSSCHSHVGAGASQTATADRGRAACVHELLRGWTGITQNISLLSAKSPQVMFLGVLRGLMVA